MWYDIINVNCFTVFNVNEKRNIVSTRGICMKGTTKWILFVFLAAIIVSVRLMGNHENGSVETSVAATVLPVSIACNIDDDDYLSEQLEAQPNSVFSRVDETLRIVNTDDSLDEYLTAVGDAIPGLYIQTETGAGALAEYLKANNRMDVMVAVTTENAPLARMIKDELPSIQCMVDFSDIKQAITKEELANVVEITNAAGARIALISSETATQAAVKYLQSRLITVWVRTGDDLVETLTMITNGVNGLMVRDTKAARNATELFEADIPVLLRQPLIIGHRGLPSEYVENTLRSEQTAVDAGADLLEYDIYLSADDEIFVLHDSSLKRLFNRADITNAEALTLAELQAIPFDSDSTNGVQVKNHTPAKDSVYGTISVSPEDRIPSLRELFTAFIDTDIIHMVEIKSENAEIVQKLRDLAEECGVEDQINVISFNAAILQVMAETWPEMSLGCLGYDDAKARDMRSGKVFDPEKEIPYENHAKLVSETDGNAREAVLALTRVTGPYNGTYNPSNANLSYVMLEEGRSYGITAWPWTYNAAAQFAEDYLKSINGLTTNFTTWASELPEWFDASDGDMHVGETLAVADIFKAEITTHIGGNYTTVEVEPIVVSGQEFVTIESGSITALKQGSCLLLLRTRIPLIISDKDYGAYYIYANPVTLMIEP